MRPQQRADVSDRDHRKQNRQFAVGHTFYEQDRGQQIGHHANRQFPVVDNTGPAPAQRMGAPFEEDRAKRSDHGSYQNHNYGREWRSHFALPRPSTLTPAIMIAMPASLSGFIAS